jgi:hypothetical protein
MSDKLTNLKTVKFKEGLTEIDYLRLMAQQNQTIIQLLIAQSNSLIQGGVNALIMSNYKKSIDNFIDNTPPPKEIPEEKKAMIENLKRRQDEGEDISKMITDLGLSEYFK